jgi:hypothetical protein
MRPMQAKMGLGGAKDRAPGKNCALEDQKPAAERMIIANWELQWKSAMKRSLERKTFS